MTNPPSLIGLMKRFNPDLSLLALIAICLLHSQLSGYFLPYHDTFALQNQFLLFYNSLTGGDIPFWMPFCNFGISFRLFLLMSVSPGLALAATFGHLASVTDMLLIYRAGIALDHLSCLLSLYLLARHILKSRIGIWYVTLIGFTSTIWFRQMHFEFTIHYLFPLVLYLILLAIENTRLDIGILATIVMILSFAGAPPYLAPIWLFTLTVFLMCTLASAPQWPIRLLQKARRTNILLLAVSLSLALLYAVCALKVFASSTVISPMREFMSGKNSLDIFLSYWVFPPEFNFALYLTGEVDTNRDVKYYLGLSPLFFAVWGLFRSNHKWKLAFTAPALALAWLSLGAVMASLVYYFPAMCYFRHLNHVFSLLNVFVLILAALGLDDFIATARKRDYLLFALVMLFIGETVCSQRLRQLLVNDPWSVVSSFDLKAILSLLPWQRAQIYALSGLAGALLLGLAERRASRTGQPVSRRLPVALLLLASVIDIFSFRALELYRLSQRTCVLSALPDIVERRTLDNFQVRPFQYQPRRLLTPARFSDLAPPSQLPLIEMEAGLGICYSVFLNFLQTDIAWSQFRAEFLSAGIPALYMARGYHLPVPLNSFKEAPGADDAWLNSTIGVTADKLRIFHRATFSQNWEDALSNIKQTRDPDTLIVTNGEPAPAVLAALARPAPPDADPVDRVEVTAFTPNRLRARVNVAGSEAAWLYYADAYTPEWAVKVDGQRVPLAEAFLAFKAVLVPPGAHEVEFYYGNDPWRPAYLILLAIYALFGLALAGLFLVCLGVRIAPDRDWFAQLADFRQNLPYSLLPGLIFAALFLAYACWSMRIPGP